MAQNALERLSDFPYMMNWRGTWLATEQYIKNDVVISPLNTAAYILLETSLLDGSDPSSSSSWAELAPSATGITQLSGGVGITVTDPTGPITTITNDGVLSLISGANISVDNTDPQNPKINSTALSGVSAGLGISVSGHSFSPTITNTGVRTLAVVAPGLSTSGDPNNPSIATSAVLSITQGNGILVTGGQTPTITNNGVISITAGPGINVNNTDPRNPIITNLGIVSLAGGVNIVITGTTTNPIVSARVPVVTVVSVANNVIPLPPQPTPPTLLSQILIAPSITDIFYDFIFSGPPDANGIFFLDLTCINFFLSAATPVPTGEKITVYIIDNTTTPSTPILFPIGEIIMDSTPNAYPFQIRPSMYPFNITALRATGFRSPDGVGFLNQTTAVLEINTWSDIYATYYPQGIL